MTCGTWCGVNLGGESGRSQITFDEQKLQLRHNDLLVKIQLFVINFKGAAFNIVSGRSDFLRPGKNIADKNQFGCRRRNAGISR
jgi:hypothetical protein